MADRGRVVHALHPDNESETWTHCGTPTRADTRFALYRSPDVTCARCLVAQARREEVLARVG